jgi:4-aminobutyrate aminotransferase/(S)-3-amino-2-methylpropionate transaminase
MINAADSDTYERFKQGNIDACNVAPHDFADILRENVMPIAPAGMSNVTLCDGSVTGANEGAIAHAMTTYAQNHGRKAGSVLGFENASHGNSVATLSVSDSRVNTANSPTFDWPKAALPAVKYPQHQFSHENAAAEAEALQNVADLITQHRDANTDIAAIIIEPISAFENKQATPTFYKKLRALAKEHGVVFICDETRTGVGASGKMWAHEHWYLNEDMDGGAPDLVTFGGRAGISGFYSSREYAPLWSSEQHVNVVDVLSYGSMWRTIQARNYLKMVDHSGSFLKIELGNIERDFHGLVRNVRGNGTYLGFDVASQKEADLIQSWLLKCGILVGRSGPATLSLRPALCMLPLEAKHLREALKNYSPHHNQHRTQWA